MTTATRLGPHVAWLAESDQVFPLVGLFGSSELPERPDVVYRQAGANELSAVRAVAALADHDDHADLSPAAPAVGLHASDPERRRGARLVLPAVAVPARLRAVPSAELRAAYPVRLPLEVGAACSAGHRDCGNVLRVCRPEHYGRLRVLLGRSAHRVHSHHPGYACAALRAKPPTSALPVACERRYRLTARFARGNDTFNGCRHTFILPGPGRPFGGTGTTALVADVLGRCGITFDRSADYCRLARWRTTDPAERAKAMQVPKPPPVPVGQQDLFGGEVG
jgi:hypothetical protein